MNTAHGAQQQEAPIHALRGLRSPKFVKGNELCWITAAGSPPSKELLPEPTQGTLVPAAHPCSIRCTEDGGATVGLKQRPLSSYLVHSTVEEDVNLGDNLSPRNKAALLVETEHLTLRVMRQEAQFTDEQSTTALAPWVPTALST